MFERIISIDWSGAAREDDRVNLRVAAWDRSTGVSRIQLPSETRMSRSWCRSECRAFLQEVLSGSRRTLVAADFGFGLPWGADQAIFRVQGWREMIRCIGRCYAAAGTVRAMAQTINTMPQFRCHGPYRFDDNRTDFHFYLKEGVGYYRLTDMAAPQAISQWYLGSGGTVGFHSISPATAVGGSKILAKCESWARAGEQERILGERSNPVLRLPAAWRGFQAIPAGRECADVRVSAGYRTSHREIQS